MDDEKEVTREELLAEIEKAKRDNALFYGLYSARGPMVKLLEYGEFDPELFAQYGVIVTELIPEQEPIEIDLSEMIPVPADTEAAK